MKLSRVVVLVGLMLFLLVAGASAQDNEWKGFYIGGNAGANIGKSDAHTFTHFSPTGYFATTSIPAIASAGTQHPDSTGFTGGGQAGYNFQSGKLLFGLEADMGAMLGSDTRSTTAGYPCCPPTTFTVVQRVEHQWLFTARPRLGVASGKALFYVTGGLAMTNLNYRATFTDTFAAAQESAAVDETKVGWTVGGGLEYLVSPHWSLKGEYLYADFGQVATTSTNLTATVPPGTFPSNVFIHNADLTSHIVRFGVNYHFAQRVETPTSATCSVSPSEVFAGEPVQATASTSGFNPKHSLNYAWTSTGGAISGKDASASVDTNGMNPGSYTVNAHVTDAKKAKATASCNATFAIKERPKHPPQISCSANPATVQSGTPSNITCTCSTPDTGAEYQPPVTTSIGNWTSSAGKVSGNEGNATLDTAGVGTGPITVSATCTDNRGLSSPGSATVNVEVPPPAPQASRIGECEFKPGAKPARVDNECKAKLDDYALALQRDTEAKGVIVGSYDEKEGKNAKAARTLAAQRAANTKEYLVKEKGIDPGRLETRVDGASGRKVEFWIVPAGATFSGEGTEVVTK